MRDAMQAISHAREIAARFVVLVLIGLLVIALGRTYVGHSPSPYGTCYGSSGRTIPCDLAKADHPTPHP